VSLRTSAGFCLTLLCLSACGSEPAAPGPECTSHADCGTDRPFCAAETETCVEPPPGSELGWGDGSAESVELTVILADASLRQPVDLAFNPSQPAELWVVNHADDSAVIITNPGEPTMTFERRKDPDASHFMHRPPALAFGAVSDTYGQTFAVCGDSDNGGNDFMGPALFSAALDIFAIATPSGLGSHLDMLHSTSFCRGIEHANNNVYYVFNSDEGSVDKYDFHADHGPGNEDHSDGEIFRYSSGEFAGVDGIPSHLSLDAVSGMLFVADTGHGRVVALDTTTGSVGPAFFGDEPAKRRRIDGAVLTEILAPGALQAPSGIELARGLLLISDDATSRLVAVDLEGNVVRSLETGLPAGSLAGLTVGPDARLYFVDMIGGRVLRVDPLP
jgi:hypothetical protein